MENLISFLSKYIPLLLLFLALQGIYCFGISNYSEVCESRECNPVADNLLFGRENTLFATSTCGMKGLEQYCVYTVKDGLPLEESCDKCYSLEPYDGGRYPKSHRIENVIQYSYPIDPKKWWQSENGVSTVSLRLDLETEFLLISSRLVFHSYVPAAMYIEKSTDNGVTWTPIAYYSNQCDRDFPGVREGYRMSLGEVTCMKHQSSHVPSRSGIVEFAAIPPHLLASSEDTKRIAVEVQKMTNLRIQFVRLNKLGDEYVDKSRLTNIKYYYAVEEWVVRGRCSCYGHAAFCTQFESQKKNHDKQIFGKCECQHNTMGINCELCRDFYNDRPWMPAVGMQSNECKKCNCNQHSQRCHFDPLLYRASGNVSGGFCDYCEHHTAGSNCNECDHGFYRNINVPITDPYTCLPCQCHTFGAIKQSTCQQYPAPASKILAGQCECRQNVGGLQCDRCLPGFWNMRPENPNGCDACDCELMGTPNNLGCNEISGQCFCKRFVTGERCDQCLPGYYNLSSIDDGCSPCACITGGTISGGQCNSQTGQCPCREGFEGRDCGRIKDEWYVEMFATSLSPMGSAFPAVINPMSKSGLYSAAVHVNYIKFAPDEEWILQFDAVQEKKGPECGSVFHPKATLKEDRKVIFFSGICLSNRSLADLRITVLSSPPTSKGHIEIKLVRIFAMGSLQSGIDYRLIELCEPYRLKLKDEWPRGCQVYDSLESIRDIVSPTLPSVLRCNCNQVGSRQLYCNKFSGQCYCKPGVDGRKCTHCQLNYYDFGPSGCQSCDCDSEGSIAQQCDSLTGQCPCKSKITDRQCNKCQQLRYRFPHCIPCECRGYASSCDQLTGACLNCTSHTSGVTCDICEIGYYGDPTSNIPCKPCTCATSSGNDFSVGCYLNSNRQALHQMVCLCKNGFKGPRCQECSPGYYGKPQLIGGTCRACECNKNIDETDPDSCDPLTGECLKCLGFSTGFNCEKCLPGYYGDASLQNCKKCMCNQLGSIPGSVCHRQTGQCPCQPNVIGQFCEFCKDNHWGLGSGEGCKACNCYAAGSESQKCNQLTGQCPCKKGFGGKFCNECEDGFWGNASTLGGCMKCDCDGPGSLTSVCDRITGHCRCREGVTGARCNQCERGTIGMLPECTRCGECWNQWDGVITQMNETITRILKDPGNLNTLLPNETNSLYQNTSETLRLFIESLQCSGGNGSSLPCAIEFEILKKAREFLAKFPKESDDYFELIRDLQKQRLDLEMLIDSLDNYEINRKGKMNDITKIIAVYLFKVTQGKEGIDMMKDLLNMLEKNLEEQNKKQSNLLDYHNNLYEEFYNLTNWTETNTLEQEQYQLLKKLVEELKQDLCEAKELNCTEETLPFNIDALTTSTQEAVDLAKKSSSLKNGTYDRFLILKPSVDKVYKLSEIRLKDVKDILKMDQFDQKRYQDLLTNASIIMSGIVSDEQMKQMEADIRSNLQRPIDMDKVLSLVNETETLLSQLKDIEDIINRTADDYALSVRLANDAKRLLQAAQEYTNETIRLNQQSKNLTNSLSEINEETKNIKDSQKEIDENLMKIDENNNETAKLLLSAKNTIDQLNQRLVPLKTLIMKVLDYDNKMNNMSTTIDEFSEALNFNITNIDFTSLTDELDSIETLINNSNKEIKDIIQQVDKISGEIDLLTTNCTVNYEDVANAIRKISSLSIYSNSI